MFLALVFIEKAQYNVNTTTNVNATNVDNTEFTILEKYWAQSGIVTWVTISFILLQIFAITFKACKKSCCQRNEQHDKTTCKLNFLPWWVTTISKLALAIIQNVVIINVIGYDKYKSMPCPLMCGKEVCQGEYGITLGFWLLLVLFKTTIQDFGCKDETENKTIKYIKIFVNVLSPLVDMAAKILVIFWPFLKCQPDFKEINHWEVYGASLITAVGFLSTPLILQYCQKLRFIFIIATLFFSLVGTYLVATRAPSLPIFGNNIGIVTGVATVLMSLINVSESCQKIPDNNQNLGEC
ncbi:uncharacterized protein OCT59_011256 [Rhizophagus irregularis]|uniref:Uncharacterized protein n=2 Tax=Rhizophagus irregularis TaxID=588596 RepID=U9SY61_RHIID|nr:hypothetical protein GLOIN_2v1540648 [Rhizophagus irregularis DAOM 181602=DAOM 197198]EXX56644.1 hypothetical protein RirG_214310 [Rhizophagus irregularis DAOM 197198w]UZO19994.1 hypothetical protein OCT59_011256 [Rhizophagus irregularis]POG78276.1 hypothetical protein GLOIN_2v1540648 [Rhizophagus irregularis DAOM 181602=DAOM 197198]CAG8715081.1 881_t:CDS:1 [Rhizophagus irregularis]GBC23680.1 hypothetical protein GLOIN_2v1540648 [Rhizophagus irregularis DAOM 181602=DAOM 197198]|eukprot:XP_025185142.1 hypothetical protein GLOIN_2v1540648 [Rhizophagus irregularis DAOM 181602=DAOM 197198]